MRKVVFHNCTVELEIPDELALMESHFDGLRTAKIKLTATEYVNDVKVRIPPMVGEIGRIARTGEGQLLTIKKVRIRHILGDIIPFLDEKRNVSLWTSGSTIEPNAVIEQAAIS